MARRAKSSSAAGWGLALAALIAAAPAASQPPAASAPKGLQQDIAFSVYPLASDTSVILKRLLTPLAADAMTRKLAATGRVLPRQAIDLKNERFTVYVPPAEPAKGYGLLVFVPPWREAYVPRGWSEALDKAGVIFVTAARSGNDANVIDRREPLALIAWANIASRYTVDPRRVWIGGFSGGSRVALRLALAYPDVFAGALMNAGADPIGRGDGPAPPPKPLFDRFQAETHLVYVTGAEDPNHIRMDADSLASMRDWCVQGVEQQIVPNKTHDEASPLALAKALAALDRPPPRDEAKLAACQAKYGREMDERLARAAALKAAGKDGEAHRLLVEIDRRFGGLAAPQSVDLATQARSDGGKAVF